jgi:hypothetical protein
VPGCALLVLVCALAPGCPDSHDTPDAAVPAAVDGAPCVPAPPADELDLLFMIDNSHGMAEQQATLVEQVPRLVRALMTGDRSPSVDADGDGVRDDAGDDFAPIESLHVGVVTSDMGAGGFSVTSCTDEPSFGDDGVLNRTGNTTIAGCQATYPAFLQLGGGETDEFARDLACVAVTGTGGCGFEQPLESVLKAVTPSTCTDPWCTFHSDTRGHADEVNAGFLRPDSVFAIVLLTDEDDCSAADPELFDRASTRYPGELDLRCSSYPTAVHPIGRYVDGLLATRARPRRLVASVIAGLPPGVSTDRVSYDEILAHPMMQEERDPTRPNRLRPSCNVAGLGNSYPPRRIVEVARGLEARGASTSSHSICGDDYSAAIDSLLDDVAESRRASTCD